jgi:alkylation response protein AidB-like acyl-CoA dehydrogenase
MPMPGVNVGDLGPKLGYGSIDNGYLSFDHYRIPRTQMLTRFAEVTKEGDLEMRGDPRILYNIMVMTRMNIISGAGLFLSRALLIATRYAVCRRQFKTIPGQKNERKLADY